MTIDLIPGAAFDQILEKQKMNLDLSVQIFM